MVSAAISSSKISKSFKVTSKQIKKSSKPKSLFHNIYRHVVTLANNTISVFSQLIYDDPIISSPSRSKTDKELEKLQEKVDQLSKELKYLLENRDISSSSLSSSSLMSKKESTTTTTVPISADDLKNITLKPSSSSSSSSSSLEVSRTSCDPRPFSVKDLLSVRLKSSLKSPVPVSRTPNKRSSSSSSSKRVSFGKDMKSVIRSSDIRKVKLKKNNNANIVNSVPSMSMRSALKKALQNKFANVNKDNDDNDENNENDWNY